MTSQIWQLTQVKKGRTDLLKLASVSAPEGLRPCFNRVKSCLRGGGEVGQIFQVTFPTRTHTHTSPLVYLFCATFGVPTAYSPTVTSLQL